MSTKKKLVRLFYCLAFGPFSECDTEVKRLSRRELHRASGSGLALVNFEAYQRNVRLKR